MLHVHNIRHTCMHTGIHTSYACTCMHPGSSYQRDTRMKYTCSAPAWLQGQLGSVLLRQGSPSPAKPRINICLNESIMKVENTQPGSSAALLTTRTTTGQRLSTLWLEIPRRKFQHTATNSAFNISSPCECMWSHVGRRRDSATRLALLSQHCSELCLRTYLSTCSMTQPDSAPQLRTPQKFRARRGFSTEEL